METGVQKYWTVHLGGAYKTIHELYVCNARHDLSDD
jgi:hypothetical protein